MHGKKTTLHVASTVYVQYSLVLEFSGEFILCLFKLLSGRDVFGDDIFHLSLHHLQFGIQLYRTGTY